MLWGAVSKKVENRVYLVEKGETTNKERYQSNVNSHVLPFIDAQCGCRDYCTFWPDLASSHYATGVQTWLPSENIDFVKRENNPPNCPQLGPIENF